MTWQPDVGGDFQSCRGAWVTCWLAPGSSQNTASRPRACPSSRTGWTNIRPLGDSLLGDLYCAQKKPTREHWRKRSSGAEPAGPRVAAPALPRLLRGLWAGAVCGTGPALGTPSHPVALLPAPPFPWKMPTQQPRLIAPPCGASASHCVLSHGSPIPAALPALPHHGPSPADTPRFGGCCATLPGLGDGPQPT